MDSLRSMDKKCCKSCGDEKLVSEFHSYLKRGIRYLRGSCRKCENARGYEYKKNNPDKVKKHKKKYRESNKEKVQDIQSIWRKDNPDKVRSIRRRYVDKNRDKVLASKKESVLELRDFYVIDLISRSTNIPKDRLKTFLDKKILENYKEKIRVSRELTNLKQKIKQK